MKPIDRFIQKLRINRAKKYIPKNSRLLDIGCADGALFQQAHEKIREGIGVDPGIPNGSKWGNFQLVRGSFPGDLPVEEVDFDVVTMLAVLEHIPMQEQSLLAQNIFKHLKGNGILIVSVPSPFVDKILNFLLFLRLIDGMSLEEHFGFHVETTIDTFTKQGFEVVRHEFFQLRLNNLFVFRKPLL